MEGFSLTHSLGGGTGSGLGSLIIKEIKSEFSDKIMKVYSVFPSEKVSDVIVEPYNTVLGMNHLIEDCDINVVLDNESLYEIVERKLKCKNVSFSSINQVIQKSLIGTTANLRFGGD